MRYLVATLLVLFATPGLAQPCPCDCNTDRTVRVSELMTGVNINFERLGMDRCATADYDGDGHVEVNDLVSGVGAALNGCPMDPAPTPTPASQLIAADLTAARALWASTALDHYRARYRVGCFCPAPTDVVMEVFDGRVVEMTDPANGQPVTPSVPDLFFTIDGLFDHIEHAIGYAEIVTAKFDAATGYPTEVFIDGSLQIADDELWVSVSDLRRLDETACRTSADCGQSLGICVAPGEFIGCGICFNHEAECAEDSDCDSDRICEPVGHTSATCACDPSVLVCKPGCDSGVDCAAGEICDADHHCVATPCDTLPCPAYFSCVTSGSGGDPTCQRSECLSDFECASDAGVCVGGECHARPGHCALPPP